MRATDDDEDSIELLDEAEALELVEFDPSVELAGTYFDHWLSG